MKKRLITLIAIGALIGAVQTGTAQDTAAYLVMIANQGTQISNQVQTLMRMDTHITQLTGQFEHLKESALGQIGAIADPIADLVAVPTDLLNTTREWHADFTGQAGSLIDALTGLSAGTSLSRSWRDVLQEADTVTEADIRNIYQGGADDAVATFQRHRDYADRRLEYTEARADAGADLMQIHAATTGAVGRIGELVDTDPGSGAPNRSAAALTEGDVLGSLAQIRTLIGIGRSRALAATEDAAIHFRQEERRREIEARRLANRAALEAQWAQERADVAARANERIESMYGGYQLPSVFNRN